ncbi:MAG TPA: hemolysin family protein [Opitutaceae bacterium]|nr:hemolysin family protein [Opitutaceae bacterium]
MQWFIMAIAATLFVSFICSMMEAVILSTTVTEVEALKRDHPKAGLLLEKLRFGMDETISAILTLNTIAGALGSAMIGALGTHLFSERILALIMAGFGVTLLVCSEVLPKNLGVAHRKTLQRQLGYPLWIITRALRPITYLCNLAVRPFVKQPVDTEKSDEEILLLAERGALKGTLTQSESSIITNALLLDEVRVSEIMTPRTVVTALRKNATVGEVFREFPNIPFARIPVYNRNLDDVVGMVRRRDLLKSKANDQDLDLVEKLMQEVNFIPETVTVANALQVFLKTHQQLLVVVDEFGATAGVLTMEDVIEQLIGREIFEKDDVAVDMRELARLKLQKQTRSRRSNDAPPGGKFSS